MLITEFGRIEFLPGKVNAEAIIVLPDNIKLVDPVSGIRSNRGFANQVIFHAAASLFREIGRAHV